MRIPRRGLTPVVMFLVATLLVSACGSGDDDDDASAGGSGSTTVRFFKSNTWDAGTGAGFFSALGEGYFEDENIEVERVEALGSATAIAALSSGSVDIAQSTPDALMNGIAQGADLVAVWQWLDPGIFGTLMAPGVDGVEDLADKRVGIINRNSATWFTVQLQLAQADMSEEDLGDVVALNCCAAQYTSLREGQVDAIGTWDGQYLTLQQNAASAGDQEWFDSLTMVWNDAFLSDILLTTRDYYEENEDVIVRFLRAFQRGEQFQIDNPEQALAHAADNLEGLDPDSPEDLAQVNMRAESYTIDGQFDTDLISESLSGYFDVGFTNVDPAALNLDDIFITSIPEQVGAGAVDDEPG